ncbi:MAG: alpha-keto acid decarboxylase family protein [Planctomycetes bacterium]|nr:alpha-keto acid decarboxylase family protein [Planctomycetota bacterium]
MHDPRAVVSGQGVATTRGLSIGQYLIRRLQDHGIRDVFGIPGDYILAFYTLLEQSPINVVGCTREDCAGFAADAYARVNGLGAVCVTYCVGGLSICNSIAGAYAEKSPVVVITGAPGLSERVNNPLLHHKVRDFRTQLDVFEKLCIASTELTDPVIAFREIDRVLDAAVRFKRPVYIEIPRDMVNVIPYVTHAFQQLEYVCDENVIREAVDEAANLISNSQRPVVIAGIEIHRFGLQDRLLALLEHSRIPFASTLLGKSVVSETHPLCIGIYEGAMGHESVTRFVEESDCVVLLGAFMTDINLGIYTANLDPGRCIYATSEQLRIRHHHYHGVPLENFLSELAARKIRPTTREIPQEIRGKTPIYELRADAPLTISRLMGRLNQQLDQNTVVIADIGDSLFAATELTIHQRTEFISPAYYTSMGFSIPASVGVCFARPENRVVVICGDGAFQMTGMELSTIVRHRFAPIVLVMDNKGYGTERVLHPGKWPFNDINCWNYYKLPEVLGGGKGYEVRTEGEFDRVLREAWSDRTQISLIQVHLSTDDASQSLRRLAERLGQRV